MAEFFPDDKILGKEFSDGQDVIKDVGVIDVQVQEEPYEETVFTKWMKTDKKKKLRRFLNRLYFAAGDCVYFLLVAFVVFLLCSLVYSLAYKQGKEDGYVSGYMNGSNGVYAEKMSSSFERGYVESVSLTAKRLFDGGILAVQNVFSEPVYRDEGVPEHDYIYVDGTITDRQFGVFQDTLGCLPPKLWESFVDDEWTLTLTEQDISLNYGGSEDYQAAGLICYADSEITIKLNSQGMPQTVLHEFGHYLDYISERPSKSDKWVKCYEEEWDNFYTMDRIFHSVGTTNEYFAEVFAWYIEKPEELKESCPMSYAFMSEQVERFL